MGADLLGTFQRTFPDVQVLTNPALLKASHEATNPNLRHMPP